MHTILTYFPFIISSSGPDRLCYQGSLPLKELSQMDIDIQSVRTQYYYREILPCYQVSRR